VNELAGGTYAWSGPGGFTSNNPDPTIPAGSAVDGDVFTVIVTDANGCTAMGESEVCILPAPTAPPTTPFEICEGSLVGDASVDGLGATCSTGETLLWYDSFSGGNQIGTGNPFMPAGYSNLAPGTYTYYAECSVGGCISDRTPVVLTITEGPEAPIVPDVTVCDGDDVNICLSLVDDGILPGNIFVSPPNSNSAASQVSVDADGCAVIASGDDGYVSGTYSVVYVGSTGCTSCGACHRDGLCM